MPNFVVISPSISLESAILLADSLGAEYINPYETKNYHFPKNKYDVVFNYGVSHPTTGVKKINKAQGVKISRNKITCLEKLKGKVPTITYTTNKKIAEGWLENGRIIVARSLVDGDNGKGLTYCKTKTELNKVKDVKFFTRYIEHTNEYRVNVWKGVVLSVYDKINKNGAFKFTIVKGQEDHPQLVMFAKEVYNATGLDWFGMDLIRTKNGNLFFLEVNSAPILFPYTITKLVNNIKKEYF